MIFALELIALYVVVQWAMVIVFLITGEYKTKKQFLFGFIPFHWIYKMVKDSWKKLE